MPLLACDGLVCQKTCFSGAILKNSERRKIQNAERYRKPKDTEQNVVGLAVNYFVFWF